MTPVQLKLSKGCEKTFSRGRFANIAIRTSPTSAMTISVYPDEEKAERALEIRAKRIG